MTDLIRIYFQIRRTEPRCEPCRAWLRATLELEFATSQGVA